MMMTYADADNSSYSSAVPVLGLTGTPRIRKIRSFFNQDHNITYAQFTPVKFTRAIHLNIYKHIE